MDASAFLFMNNSAAAAEEEREGGLSLVSLQSLCQQSLTAALINSPLCNDLDLLAVYMAHTYKYLLITLVLIIERARQSAACHCGRKTSLGRL